MAASSVVPKLSDVSEAQFRAAMLSGLARAEGRVGDKALAYIMELSPKQLGNIMRKGALPSPKRLWDALSADPSALDDIAGAYGKRIVPKGSICDTDAKAAPALVAALHKVIEAEADGSINHTELLGMETELREAGRAIDAKLAAIADLRRPREVA